MKTDNELIAEFMGWKLVTINTPFIKFMTDKPMKVWKMPSDFNTEFVPKVIREDDLKFERSWDWLMPVVEKISQHIYESYTDNNGYKDVTSHDRAYPRTFAMIDSEGQWMVRINRMPLEQGDSLIATTYSAVVEFIKWYNAKELKQ